MFHIARSLPVLKITYVAVCFSNTVNCEVVILLITEKVAKMIPSYSEGRDLP